MSRCPLTIPPHASTRKERVLPYARVSTGPSRHPRLYLPNATRSQFDRVLFNNQYHSQCTRFLVVRNDLHGAGLGYVAKLMSFALSLAVNEGRVLIEEAVERPLWCTVPPYTMQCFYRPWSDCKPPSGPRPEYKRDADHERVLALSLRKFHHSALWWGASKLMTPQTAASLKDFLFDPLPWVQRLSFCVKTGCKIAGERFVLVHMRDSPQKRRERGKLAGFDDYVKDVRDGSTVLWQTSNPELLNRAIEFSKQHGIRSCYTDNNRTINDAWGGRDPSMTAEAAAVGVVNKELARGADYIVSPQSSMWTWFIATGDARVIEP